MFTKCRHAFSRTKSVQSLCGHHASRLPCLLLFPMSFPFFNEPIKTTCRDGSVTKQHNNTSNKDLSWISTICFFCLDLVWNFLKPGVVVRAYNPRARDQEQADPWGLLASQLDLIREALSKNKDGG